MQKKKLKNFLKINDPIHGFILFPEIIRKIVDSKVFQRLLRIRQLSGTNHVFPGANHTRFEHSLGVAALSQRLLNTLRDIHNLDLSQDEINDGIVGALLHDIGHGPFSHNFESILMEKGKDHEDFSKWLIIKSEIGDILEKLGFNKNKISNIATGKSFNEKNTNTNDLLLSQVITSAINVDSMDYLLRDNYHCGTAGRSIDIDRLILSIDVVENNFLGIDINALIALEGYLLSRINSFRTIYFHKTCRSVQLMLTKAIRSVMGDLNLDNFQNPEEYIRWDDYTLWTELIKNSKSRSIMLDIQKRKFLKMCFETRIEMSEYNIDCIKFQNYLSEISNIPINEIFIDIASSPNVPYNHINETRPNEIFTFKKENDGTKNLVKLEEHSSFFRQFKGHLRIVRIYTSNENRRILTDVAAKILKNDFFKFFFNKE